MSGQIWKSKSSSMVLNRSKAVLDRLMQFNDVADVYINIIHMQMPSCRAKDVLRRVFEATQDIQDCLLPTVQLCLTKGSSLGATLVLAECPGVLGCAACSEKVWSDLPCQACGRLVGSSSELSKLVPGCNGTRFGKSRCLMVLGSSSSTS